MKNIRDFIADMLVLGCHGLGKLTAVFPLHNAQQLGRLDAQRNGQFFGCMKLLPLALIAMPNDSFREFRDLVIAHNPTDIVGTDR